MPRYLTTLTLLALLTLSGCANLGSLPGSAAPAGKEAREALKLARVLRDNGRLPGAYEVYQRMDQRQQLSGAYLLEYASVAAAVRPAGESYALYERARRELGPDVASIAPAQRQALCTGLARAALALGNASNAERDFRCALSAAPEDAQALNGLGVAQTLLGQAQQARASFTQALSINPGYSAATNNLALSWLAEGNSAQAIGLLNGARHQGDVSLQLNLALAYVLEGHDDTARRVLEEQLEPEYATRILERFSATRQRIASGAPLASELLAASQQPLALSAQD
ncbi:tetratricopeptide repeat protein [Pseudomonas aegrilactucae]|uniref:Tetratricopeptide repeat protein n=1 Tax=Pseudomonas aegrilactucae TaxID=2854028 RepID=A0A9Q2XKD2_9PSED|nr:tetratricopeptide repeat protein [Pseudomonas aegrilactucae]MBV6287889.1 tetratricopeptide repeat protein [Pseudomonas aegrilactucae]